MFRVVTNTSNSHPPCLAHPERVCVCVCSNPTQHTLNKSSQLQAVQLLRGTNKRQHCHCLMPAGAHRRASRLA